MIVHQTQFLYEKIADEFDSTRITPWNGWKRIVPYIDTQTETKIIKIADIACGNGRFAAFLKSQMPLSRMKYFGYDTSRSLLSIASQTYPEFSFTYLDCMNQMDSLETQLNCISVFGFMHHIPDRAFRSKWISKLCSHVAFNGIIILSFWLIDVDWLKRKNVLPIVLEGKQITSSDLDTGDYYIPWGSTYNDIRYYHNYSENDLDIISEQMKSLGFICLTLFEDDLKAHSKNWYMVFQKLK